jgi:hypothetical protein
MYKLWNDEEILVWDDVMRQRYLDSNTFFPSSIAAVYGMGEKALMNCLRTDSSFGFIHAERDDNEKLKAVATHSTSVAAHAMQRRENDGRRDLATWETNFVRWNPSGGVTEVSGGSGGILKRSH